MKKNNIAVTRKILYIIFSILAAVVLWLYVSYVNDEDRTVPVSGIPVEFMGEELLADNNLVVTGYNTDKLTVRFSGQRNKISDLSNKSVKAVVDLSQILSNSRVAAGVYQLSYAMEYGNGISPSGITVTQASYDYITVTVEKMVSVPVPVRAACDKVSVAEGYTARPLTCSSETITVSGPQAIVSTVSYAAVTLSQRENITKSVTEDVAVVLMDSEDRPVEADNLTLSQETVTVELDILMVKEVTLKVNLIDSASATGGNTLCSVTPGTITLSGDPEIMEDLNTIYICTINLAGFTSTYSDSFPIPLPNDVENMSGVTTADVSLQVFGTSTKRLSASNISFKNKPDNRSVTVITQSLDVTVRGAESILREVTEENIYIVADLAEYGSNTGTFMVDAKVRVDGYSGVDAIGDYRVTVQVSDPSSGEG